MKKSIKFGIILLTFYVANLAAEDKVDNCMKLHELATSLMKARQQGVAMPKLMNSFENLAIEVAETNFLKKIAIAAYDQPQYSGKEYRNKAVQKFANEWALKCYKQQ